jgi:predicted dinucleotide-binding enzyme
LKSEISGSEKVQEWAPDAKVVKAFTIYGFENFQDSSFPKYDVKPFMMIAGNDIQAKEMVKIINIDLGFETVDTGKLDQALHLEHMTLLWVKMVRRDGHHPNFVWAYLEK